LHGGTRRVIAAFSFFSGHHNNESIYGMAVVATTPFTFPFSTCERPSRSGVAAQPVSAAINAAAAAGLFASAALATGALWQVRVALLSYGAFEAWHAWSHAVHVPGTVLADVVHMLGYAMSAATLLALRALDPRPMPAAAWMAIAFAIAVDVVVWVGVHRWAWSHLYIVATGLGVLAVVVVAAAPPRLRASLPWLLAGLLVLLALFVNEAVNCEAMLAAANLPYHAAVELLGLALFAGLALALL
jgi:hypothetical protein